MSSSSQQSREILSLNRDWRFFLGEEVPDEAMIFENMQILNNETSLWQKTGNFGISKPGNPYTAQWRSVDLPHDYALEGEFSRDASVGTGSLPHGKAWYVKRFILEESDRGRRIAIEFDGVYRNCSVYMNGHFVGRHLSGYTSFGFDVTEVCHFGAENAVAVFVDATDNELWSYEGAGIYRGVRLVKTSPVAVPQWGTYVTTGDEDDPGQVNIEVTVRNMNYADVDCRVVNRILSPSGDVVLEIAPQDLSIGAVDEMSASFEANIDEPELWSVDDPKLYSLQTIVEVNGVAVDSYETPFGVRYYRIDPETGFYLNGVSMKLKGMCCHQDHACVGVAVPPGLQAWRVQRLKEIGCNAIRTSHNPPDPALLDACDRLGMMVMDEVRLPGASEEILGQLESLIRRDRNHPSVILWSLGNEEMSIQHTEIGLNMFRRMQHLARKLDPSRLTIYAMNMQWIDICDIHAAANFRFDIFGTNYRSGQQSEHYDEFHQKYPDWPLIGAETYGGAATRGLFGPDKSHLPVQIDDRWLDGPERWRDEQYVGIASAYGGTSTPWGYSLEEAWLDCVERPYMAGTFLWTGFDYRGETFPYDWPSVISRFGVLDHCGFYKETTHYLRAWWRQDAPHIFIFPHWNWQGREGELIDVWCYANSHSVELFLNGESLGRKAMPENFRLSWDVPYTSGALEARGYDAEGNLVISTMRRTAGAPATVVLKPSTEQVVANGEEVVVIEVSVVDKNGEFCPLADDTIEFGVEGPLEIMGVGNGDPLSHEPDTLTNQRRAYHGLCQVILRSTGEEGSAKLVAGGWGLAPAEVGIELEAV